jgi:hypothetical protein
MRIRQLYKEIGVKSKANGPIRDCKAIDIQRPKEES